MMARAGKRSSDRELEHAAAAEDNQVKHPGGSAGQAELPARGGGYLDGCSSPGPDSGGDPRLRELCEIGLDRRWVAVAEQIGVDAFLEAWQTLDEHTDKPWVCIPKFRAWLRRQRNKAIRDWRAQGLSNREIRRRVARHYRESLSERHVDRILAGDSMRS